MKQFIVISFLFFGYSNAFSQWTQTSGPSGGGVSEFAFVGDTILAATFDYGNGVFASTDNGTSWHASGLQGVMINHITTFGNTVIASSTQNSYNETDTVYRSSDGGVTWKYTQITLKDNSTRNGTIPNIDAISSICYHNHEWFIATEGLTGCMYRSDDDGLTWRYFQPAGFSFVYPVKLVSAGVNIYSGTTVNQHPTIYSSTDATTWNPITVNSSLSSEIYCGTVSGNTVIFGIDGGVIYSQIGGNGWTQPVMPGFNDKSEYIAHIAGSGNNIIAVTSQSRVFVSHDGSVSWTPLTGNGLPGNASYLFSVGYDETANMIFLSTSEGTLSQDTKSVSNQWVFATEGLLASSITDLAEDQGSLFALTERGVSYSTDEGNSWHDPQNFTDLEDVPLIGFTKGEMNLYAYGNGIYAWTGSNWNTIDTGQVTAFTESSIRLIACRDTGDPISGASRIEFSDNGGVVWNPRISFANSFDTEFYFMPRSIVSNGSGTIVAIQRAVSYLSFTSDYFVYRSTDNGFSWTQSGKVNKPALLYFAGNEFYLGTIGHGIYHSVDDGLTWSQLPGIPDGADVTSILKINNSIFISVTGNGVALDGLYFSNDDGSSWHYANYGNVNIFGPLAADGAYLFSGGPSVWRRQLQGLDVKDKQVAKQNSSLQIYPNPASDNIQIHFSSDESQGTIIIFDEKGMVVSRDNILNPAKDITISIQDLPESTYYVEFVDKNSALISSARFVVQRN